MNGIKGFSFIWHLSEILYLGKYVAGIFSDNNYRYRNPNKEGWGIKIDIYLAPIIRPVPKFWKKEFYQERPIIADRVTDVSVFGSSLWAKLRKKRMFGVEKIKDVPDISEVHDYKYNLYNPWKGIYWFVLRIPACIPLVFFSVSTPWRSFYCGFKTSKIEPFLRKPPSVDQGDYTWCGQNEMDLANKAGGDMFRSSVPSGSIRRDRV